MGRRRGRAALAALVALTLPAAGPGRAAAGPLEEALRRLQADDVLVADAAVEELVSLGGPAARALLPLLEDPRRDVRAGAIRGLGLLREPAAAGALREDLGRSLDDPAPDTFDDRYFRILAVQALGRIGDGGSADLLRAVASRGDAHERAHAGISLFLLGEDPGYDVVRECLADTATAIRNVAVQGLGDSQDPRARTLVLSMTSDPSWVVRDSAFRALRRWPVDPEIGEAIERGAADPSWFVRETVAEVGRGHPAPETERGER
ncbi:MAG: HEAT repeat domain-containing protein [Candidatus Eiseniibacteriota bacterium]